MKSMTGFAKRQCEIEGHKITIEIKTLNSKQMDVNVKLPFAYREKDLAGHRQRASQDPLRPPRDQRYG